MIRDFVPRPIIFDLQSAIFPRGRYEDALASSTEPCGFGYACGFGLFDLQSADFLCFYKVTTLGFDCFFWLLP